MKYKHTRVSLTSWSAAFYLSGLSIQKLPPLQGQNKHEVAKHRESFPTLLKSKEPEKSWERILPQTPAQVSSKRIQMLQKSVALGAYTDTYWELAPFGSSPSEEEEWEESGPRGDEALEVR